LLQLNTEEKWTNYDFFFLRINGILSTAALTMLNSGWKGCVGGDCIFSWVCRMCGTSGSWLVMRGLGIFQANNTEGPKKFPSQPLPRIEVLQKHSLFDHCVPSTRGVKLGDNRPMSSSVCCGLFY